MNKLIGKIQRRFIIGDDFLEKLATLSTAYSDDFREEVDKILRGNRKTLKDVLKYGISVTLFALIVSYIRPDTDAWIVAVASVIVMLIVAYNSIMDSALQLGSEGFKYIEALPQVEKVKVCKHFEASPQREPYSDAEYYQVLGYTVYIDKDKE